MLGDVTIGTLATRFLEHWSDIAPSLLLAYALTGMLAEFAPAASISWLGRGSAPVRALKGMVIGAPLPLCSCSTLPLFHRLSSTPRGATAAIAFLLAGPEIGLDAVFISWPMLGVPLTILRLVTALGVAFLVASLVGSAVDRRHEAAAGDARVRAPMPMTASRPPLTRRLRNVLHYGFEESLGHTAPWVLLGLLMATLIELTPAATVVAAWPIWLQVLALTAVGMPTYVCASAATPLVATLLAGGVSPGAGIALLIAGPATNLTTFGLVTHRYGRRAGWRFVSATLGITVMLALAADAVARRFAWQPSVEGLVADEPLSLWRAAATVIATLLILRLIVRRGPRQFLAELRTPFSVGGHDHGHGHAHHAPAA